MSYAGLSNRRKGARADAEAKDTHSEEGVAVRHVKIVNKFIKASLDIATGAERAKSKNRLDLRRYR
jgi:hypothetical protein